MCSSVCISRFPQEYFWESHFQKGPWNKEAKLSFSRVRWQPHLNVMSVELVKDNPLSRNVSLHRVVVILTWYALLKSRLMKKTNSNTLNTLNDDRPWSKEIELCLWAGRADIYWPCVIRRNKGGRGRGEEEERRGEERRGEERRGEERRGEERRGGWLAFKRHREIMAMSWVIKRKDGRI